MKDHFTKRQRNIGVEPRKNIMVKPAMTPMTTHDDGIKIKKQS